MTYFYVILYLAVGLAWGSGLLLVTAFMGVGASRLGVVLNVVLWPVSFLAAVVAIITSTRGLVKPRVWRILRKLVRL